MNETKTKKGKRKEGREGGKDKRKKQASYLLMIKNVSIEACPCVSIVEFKKGRLKPGMVVYAFNFSTWEAEAGGVL